MRSPAASGGEHPLRRQRRLHPHPAGARDHPGRARRGIERTTAPAGSILEVGAGEGQVRDLTGRAAAPPEELPVEDEPHAHPRAQMQVDEVLDILAEPVPSLAEGRQVDVVLERRLCAQLLLHRIHDAFAAPSGQAVGERHLSTVRLEHSRTAHGGERHLTPPDPGVCREGVRDGADLGDQRTSALHPRALVTPRDELPGDVGDRRADPVAPDVDAHDPPGPGIQLVQQRGRPLATLRTPRLLHQAGPLETCERLRHRGLGQRRLTGDLRPGDRSDPPNALEHRPLVDRPEQARRAGRCAFEVRHGLHPEC